MTDKLLPPASTLTSSPPDHTVVWYRTMAAGYSMSRWALLEACNPSTSEYAPMFCDQDLTLACFSAANSSSFYSTVALFPQQNS